MTANPKRVISARKRDINARTAHEEDAYFLKA
jgi:hypothetical protein